MKIAFILGTFFQKLEAFKFKSIILLINFLKLGIGVKLFIYNKTDIRNNKYEIIVLEKLLINIVFVFKYYLNLNIFFF